jgi:aspartokinase
MMRETGFEKPRGVNRIEVRKGFAQVHVSRLAEPIVAERLRVLRAVADVDVSIDFLKLTPSGLSFIIAEDRSDAAESALAKTGTKFSLRKQRTIVLVHAVNIRDEEGLIAEIIRGAIASGAHVDHIGDMHDRVLMVVKDEDVERVSETFRRTLMEESQ